MSASSQSFTSSPNAMATEKRVVLKNAGDEEAPLMPKRILGGGKGKAALSGSKWAQLIQWLQEGNRSRVTRAIVVALMHISCSAGLILYNKHILDKDRFPFPIQLTMMHMTTSLALSIALRQLVPSLFPSSASADAWFRKAKGKSMLMEPPIRLWAFVPVGLCCAFSVVAANAAYTYASVSFLQMVKESVILWVYLLTVMSGVEAFKLRYLFVLGFVTIAAALAVSGDVHFLWMGLLLQLFSSSCQAMQAVLMGSLMSPTVGTKIDPMTMVLGTAPVVLCVLFPVNLFFWDASIPRLASLWWKELAGNAMAAFILQVVNAITIRELSATGLALAAVLKDLAIVGSAAVLLHESLTTTQLVGFAGAVTGISLYSYMKLNPTQFDLAPLPPRGTPQRVA